METDSVRARQSITCHEQGGKGCPVTSNITKYNISSLQVLYWAANPLADISLYWMFRYSFRV